MPVCWIKIFNRFQFESGGVDFFFDRSQFFKRPELVRVAGKSPTGVVADGLVAGLVAARGTEIVHEMDDQMRAAALLGEAIMFRVELMAIEAQSEFHGRNYRAFEVRSKTSFTRRQKFLNSDS